ncbi:myophilin [Trichonephila clavipes]|uniref:Transgelin n=2 Tax=Trichonephila TaxID=2585208 RepID=A0A8X7B9Q4_TRICX|nr:myophilin [Trichonephila clavipes]GFY57510.1 myophilin [Trichonephila inaurata madagascariensis]
MAENRATKSGLAAEAHSKIQSKYDPALASQILLWMKDVMGEPLADIDTSGEREPFYQLLKDGQVLCRLINVLQPGSIPEKKINNTKMAFKCMENINLFLDQVKKLGVPAEETFQTVDLWEQQNLTSVLICLQSLARKASKFGFKSIGPKEAEANVRQFTDEQLKAGQGVISLQYGSNKGANQSGINFGNTRHM